MNSQVFEDSLFLIQDGYESEDHPIYAKAHAADLATQIKCARLMEASTSEFQAVKYMQLFLEGRQVEPGFRTKAMDAVMEDRHA